MTTMTPPGADVPDDAFRALLDAYLQRLAEMEREEAPRRERDDAAIAELLALGLG